MAQETKTEELTSKAVVIDNGTGIMKAGISGSDTPSTVFPTMIGHSKQSPLYHGMDKKEYIGKEVKSKLAALSVTQPIQCGKITNWNDMESIYSHIFENELKISVEEYAILTTEPALNSKADRIKLTELMFERFNCLKYYCSQQSVLALYASNRSSGVVLDIGYDCTEYVPVWDGYVMSHAVIKDKYGGSNVTEYLGKLMLRRGYSFIPSVEKLIMNDIKEKICYAALDFEKEKNDIKEKEFEMPDGAVISVGVPRFQCVEGLFKPKLMGFENDFGIHLMVSSIGKIDMSLRKSLYGNIVLCGGSSLFEGMAERLENEVKLRAPKEMEVNVVADENRKYSVWIGGSMLCEMDSFEKLWISKEQFDECGPSIVNRKCV